MVRRIVLLTILFAVGAASIALPSSEASAKGAGACSGASSTITTCAEHENNVTRIDARQTANFGAGTRESGEGLDAPERQLTEREIFCLLSADYDACLRVTLDAFTAVPRSETANTPTVTLDDLVSFSPRADRLSAEPGDWAIAGLAVNPVADDAPAAASGELLGLPAEVRFTPVEFLWDHGDGSTLSTPDGGATWAELGQAEFSETATSHVYEQPGTYTLSLAVRFAAEYSVGGGPWTPVAGTLLADSGAFDITVGSAGTVLVDRDCRTGARGPGC